MKTKRFNIIKLIFIPSIMLLFLLLVSSSQSAKATFITVDGDPTDWPGNPTCVILAPDCSLLQTDPAESLTTTMPPGTDIIEVWGTNSPSDVYFRFDTQGTTTNFGNGEFVRLCLDIPSQGPGQTNVGGCIGHSTDRMIRIINLGLGLQAIAYDCNAVDCSAIFPAGVGTATFAQNGVVNELGVDISLLGLTPADDGSTMATIVYFDNGGSPPDDNVPDSGSFPWPIGTNSPTAVNLQQISTEVNTSPILGLIVVLLLIGITGTVVLRRRSRI